jgi:integrase
VTAVTKRTSGKRGNGEGAIYRDATGRWRAVLDLGYREGKRSRKYVSGQTRTEVAGKLRRLLDEQDAGFTITSSEGSPTLEAWLAHWLDTIAAPRLRPSTLATYRGYVNNRIVPNLGRHQLNKLQPEHLEKFYASLAEEGLKAATIVHVHRILSRALKVAMQRGRVRRNVATLVQPPSIDREEIRPLTGEQARAVLAAAQGERNAARWSVALALGLRQGEALGLAWEAVDLDAGTLTVRQALQRQSGGGLVLVPPKSRAGRRTIPIPDQLVQALRAHRDVQAVERTSAGTAWSEQGLVFVGPRGKPIDPSNDYQSWRRLLERAGVPPARLHDARHTAATLLLSQGVSARVVMELLGHSQISLTLGTYTHVVPALAREAADRMGAELWGPGGVVGAS